MMFVFFFSESWIGREMGYMNIFIDTDGCEAVLTIAHPTQVKIGNQLNLFLLAVAE